MTDPTSDGSKGYERPADQWRFRRIWVCGACGLWLGGSHWLLDFWALGGRARSLVDLSRTLVFLTLPLLVVGLLIAAGAALWRRRLRRATSSALSVVAIPCCFMIASQLTLLDPWLWYVIVNKARLEVAAASDSSQHPKFITLAFHDVSAGIAGLNPNHFVFLIYDESDVVGIDPRKRPINWTRRLEKFDTDVPKGRWLAGHFFRVDVFDD